MTFYKEKTVRIFNSEKRLYFSFLIDTKNKQVCYTIVMNKQDKERMAGYLLAWYDANKRILPWRENPTPYAVWVSEIMLQQTRVEAVKPYFHRFMQQLPDIQSLATCDDDQLAKLWEGLGYYHRVRNMKKCAITCVEKYNGQLPSTYEELLTLPGIGAYTAGAIASIAFKQKVPAVDGNVLRVFSRILCSEDDIGKETTKKKFQSIIQTYLPSRVNAYNQALMEIGAMICVPNTRPHCNRCPLATLCKAHQKNKEMQYPIKQSKKARKIEQKTIAVVLFQNHVHLHQRDAKGLLANLYEFDTFEGHLTKQSLLKQLKPIGNISSIVPLQDSKHIFTHKEWHMKGWLVLLDHASQAGLWATQKELLETYAIPSALRIYKQACLIAMEEDIMYE